MPGPGPFFPRRNACNNCGRYFATVEVAKNALSGSMFRVSTAFVARHGRAMTAVSGSVPQFAFPAPLGPFRRIASSAKRWRRVLRSYGSERWRLLRAQARPACASGMAETAARSNGAPRSRSPSPRSQASSPANPWLTASTRSRVSTGSPCCSAVALYTAIQAMTAHRFSPTHQLRRGLRHAGGLRQASPAGSDERMTVAPSRPRQLNSAL